jgi:hypothetical protein
MCAVFLRPRRAHCFAPKLWASCLTSWIETVPHGPTLKIRGGVGWGRQAEGRPVHQGRKADERAVDATREIARVMAVQVVLRKLGRGSRAVAGRLVRAPRKGSVVVIEFSDGMHEYVTTPVKRVLRLASRDVFYIETVNSRYRLEVRDRERALEDVSSG